MKCNKCNEDKSLNDFYFGKYKKKYKYSNVCKKCECAYKRNEYKNKKNIILERNKLWVKNNKEKVIEYQKDYRIKNKEKLLKNHCEYLKELRNKDPSFKLRKNVSRAIYGGLKQQGSSKNSPAWSRLPYTPQQLKKHLEDQFEDWMSWENYGICDLTKKTWNIDHIIPQILFPYDTMDHPNFQKCWALENLRPLCAIENILKRDNYDEALLN